VRRDIPSGSGVFGSLPESFLNSALTLVTVNGALKMWIDFAQFLDNSDLMESRGLWFPTTAAGLSVNFSAICYKV